MKYGFVIDNRKCIGCHACTTACKSEHQVPVGVNRTYVKQVEKGTFPDTRRLFSVMRCNHCTDAPCVEICPTEALHFRPDGIVDFDKDRCIGCKSCMQACPYDALYIDPENHTAAKCNYCAHRIDVGLEPACVNVCPEHAIISGDMDDPNSEISELLARQAVKVRKPEKGTTPNLFYIDADDLSLVPSATTKSNVSLWGSQSLGVGHYAKEAEKLAFTNEDLIAELVKINGGFETEGKKVTAPKTVEVLMEKGRAVYDTPNKGILWGWEVSAYVWTKAISAGAFLLMFLGWILNWGDLSPLMFYSSIAVSLVFLGLTGVLLVMDLDRPDRFLNVLLRPHWGSWLVRGGYSISVFGALLVVLAASKFFGWDMLIATVMWITGLVSLVVAVYTAFLFGQAKGRDFWQSPTLSIHMLVHSFMAGTAVYMLAGLLTELGDGWNGSLNKIMLIAVGVNLLTMLFEMTSTHPTKDAKTTVHMILQGRYSSLFWMGVIGIGNILPFLLLLFMPANMMMAGLAGVLVLAGIYMTEKIWVEAPQRIALS
jgi:Fe-S-cluster-containing dehydrogenase component/formate-dependent nitrite reductase membrane component NrfD